MLDEVRSEMPQTCEGLSSPTLEFLIAEESPERTPAEFYF